MYTVFSRYTTLVIVLFLFSFHSVHAGLTVNPGTSRTVCKGDSVTLGNLSGSTASGGTAPYNYTWSPPAGMNNPSDSNPHVLVSQTTMFYVTVTDAAGGRVIDSIQITISPLYQANAGNDTSICPLTGGGPIGGSSNLASYNYSWTPVGATGLSCYNCAHPTANPSATTTYTLNVTSGGCADSSQVIVTVLPSPTITVTSPVSVKEGYQVTLNASGAVSYTWTPGKPDTNIFNQNSSDPQVSPASTTTYTVVGIGANGCPGFNTVVVDVIPDSNLVIYNTFTPNGDGINDTWFIGNLDLYPNNTLTIFNRYGKQVYYAQPYSGTWDGTTSGEELPDATYYYILQTGKGSTYRGSVTIIRKKQ